MAYNEDEVEERPEYAVAWEEVEVVTESEEKDEEDEGHEPDDTSENEIDLSGVKGWLGTITLACSSSTGVTMMSSFFWMKESRACSGALLFLKVISNDAISSSMFSSRLRSAAKM